ncbi:unnamed protein product, partial [Rotaria sp. Silwood2]
MDLQLQYPPGSTFIWWGFSSCTLSIDVLENEQFFGKNGTRTLFNIECYSGKNIEKHSFYGNENEILLLPGRQFKVVGCLNVGKDLHMIQIKETESPFPLIPVPDPRPPISIKKIFGNSDQSNTTLRPSTTAEAVTSKPKPV